MTDQTPNAGCDARCGCVGYTIRTDYGTGVEYDVDRSMCAIHGDAPNEALLERIENALIEYDEDAHLFGTSGAGAFFLAKFLAERIPLDVEVKAWRDAADKVDTGPTFPLLPSIISALLREHADALEAHYATRPTPPGGTD